MLGERGAAPPPFLPVPRGSNAGDQPAGAVRRRMEGVLVATEVAIVRRVPPIPRMPPASLTVPPASGSVPPPRASPGSTLASSSLSVGMGSASLGTGVAVAADSQGRTFLSHPLPGAPSLPHQLPLRLALSQTATLQTHSGRLRTVPYSITHEILSV